MLYALGLPCSAFLFILLGLLLRLTWLKRQPWYNELPGPWQAWLVLTIIAAALVAAAIVTMLVYLPPY